MIVEKDDNIKVHYTGKTNAGQVFDSSLQREPLGFKVGEGKLLKAFEEAVLGMKLNDSVEINIPAEEGYGPVREDLIAEVDKKNLGPEVKPEIGMELMSKYPDGTEVIVRITEVNDETIKVDANHPLAGEDLNFEITVVEIDK